jgi:CubicO group peptidase (beta-lactamase class C family)
VKKFVASSWCALAVACSSQPRPPVSVTTRAATQAEAPKANAFFDEGAKTPWTTATPEQAGLKRDAVAKLVEAAERTDSDSLLVIHRDRVVVARSFGHAQEPLELMSVTKGFAGLAIGFLIDEGKISSLDAPMSTWFPEWKDDKRKARVTLRHVLTHTSGLAHKPAAGELFQQADRVAYVRALPIETEPGEVFSYSNEATQLLSVVITSSAGEPVDSYMKKKLFDPLGIERFTWERDKAGNASMPSGLFLSAVDLAKVGIMLRDDGIYRTKRVVSTGWIAQMQQPAKSAQWMGLLTWLLRDDTAEGWNFNGWLGQYLVVYPRAGVIGVRQRRQPKNVTDNDNDTIGMKNFPELVRAALP